MAIPTLPFSKSRRADGLVFLSGELPFGPDGTIPEGIGAQTDLALDRIAATLEGEGLSLADVVSCLVHLTDKADFAAFNEAYARRFPEPHPVRTTVVAGLLVDARIEITVTAKART
ncbi:enamine deaminase RidA (YjgF/YER057c/UK114 family) [Azospirillum lipoferum]|uniref:RidA family protein n=1 Tax=Azospirillum lipoferum TaxID=193 RepID=A0A5A9GQI5_AZOLI|nr:MULTISPECIES: RidA family protein [Azospirillum]KAA0595569.1 RidA family protein [Azospirillum lipoferum]MCP1611585.1 enamine deaminase RidA (YjgF/YER057c/UK114 family) [Azospirillum lipoferum]MDW5537385.1 RidA family protein [Azospirillum sp. NL1]